MVVINNKAQEAKTTMKCHRIEESNKPRYFYPQLVPTLFSFKKIIR